MQLENNAEIVTKVKLISKKITQALNQNLPIETKPNFSIQMNVLIECVLNLMLEAADDVDDFNSLFIEFCHSHHTLFNLKRLSNFEMEEELC